MREADDDVVRRARIFADTRIGAFGEAGDILQPIASRSHTLRKATCTRSVLSGTT